MSVPMSDSSTPPVSKYARERSEAMGKRIKQMEANVEVGVRALMKLNNKSARRIAGALRDTVLVEDFRSALLCSTDTTDAQLDHWLPLIDENDAANPESEAQD